MIATTNKQIFSFRQDLELLSRVPLLPSLCPDSVAGRKHTLLDWINQKDHQEDLEAVAQRCLQSLQQYSQDSLSEKRRERDEIITVAEAEHMKEIKGLAERLYGLEELLHEASKICEDQSNHSSTIYKQLKSWMARKDSSLLPELCHQHKIQLELMNENYKKLQDYRRRIIQAKVELSDNLNKRLRWVMHSEREMTHKNTLILRKNIERLSIQLEAVKQIHLAPKVYVAAVVEAVRRRKFHSLYLKWTTMLSSDSSAVFDNETKIRSFFENSLNEHFLATLFPGMSDFPPPFGLDPLPSFDSSLPDLTERDVHLIREKVPQLFDQIPQNLQDHFSVLSKYLESVETELPVEHGDGHLLTFKHRSFVEQSFFVAQIRQMFQEPQKIRDHLKSLKEDLLICHQVSKQELTKILQSIEAMIQNKQKQFDLTIQKISQDSVDALEEKTLILSDLQNEIIGLKNQNQVCRQDFNEKQSEYESRLKNLMSEHEKLKMTILEKEIELEDEQKKSAQEQQKMIEQLSQKLKAREDELNQQKAIIQNGHTKIEDMARQLESSNDSNRRQIDNALAEKEAVKIEFERRGEQMIANLTEEKNRALREQKELLMADHKNEMESLRSRFKLAVSTSTIEQAQDVSRSLDNCTDRMEELQKIISEMSEEMESKKSEFKGNLEEKELVIHDLRTKLENATVTHEAISVPSTMETSCTPSTEPLVANLTSATDHRLSIYRYGKELWQQHVHLIFFLEPNSCDVGDLVLFCFTEKYNSYAVFTMLPVLHFLHSDSGDCIPQNRKFQAFHSGRFREQSSEDSTLW